MSIATVIGFEPRAVEEPDLTTPRRMTWRPAWTTVVSVACAVAPFVAAAVRAASRHVVLGSDYALTQLALSDAERLHQFVGPYSRMGWAHPGPEWFHLLTPVYALLGGGAAALISAFLFLQAVCAGAVVVSVGRAHPWTQPLAALLVTCFALRVVPTTLVYPWNPYALVLPALLLLLLAGRAAAGSAVSLAGVAAVSTFLLQTHVGTAPLVAAVGVTAVVGWWFTRSRPSPREWRLVALWLLGALLPWVSPLYQQLRAVPGQGNAAEIARYFLHVPATAGPTPTWNQAASIVARLLAGPMLGHDVSAHVMTVTGTDGRQAVVLAVQGLGTLLLALVAWRLGERRSLALASVLLAGEAGAGFAAHAIRGDVYDYLVLWITALPAVLAYAWADLAVGRLRPTSWRVWVPLGLALVLAVPMGSTLSSTAARMPDAPGITSTVALLQSHLGDPRHPVLVDMGTAEAWNTAAGVAASLEQSGFRVHVTATWVHLFGQDRLEDGTERVRVVLIDPQVPDQPRPLGTVQDAFGSWAVSVTPIHQPTR